MPLPAQLRIGSRTLSTSSGVAGVFLVGTTLFLCFRAWFVPKSFGEYGHYRGASIAEIAALLIALGTVNLLLEEFRQNHRAVPALSLNCYGVLLAGPKMARKA